MAKLLLVEDDNNLREIYEARLSAEGYEIVTAQNGEEALVVAKQQHPDLIISDVMMPRISGFEMLDILRNTDELRDTKVIMLTALGQAEDQERAGKLGADKYLVKSQVTLEDIVNAAKDLLDGTSVIAPAVAVEAASPAAAEPFVAAPAAAVPAAEPAQEPAIPAPNPPAPEPSPVPPPTPQPDNTTPAFTTDTAAVVSVPDPDPIATVVAAPVDNPVAPSPQQPVPAPQAVTSDAVTPTPQPFTPVDTPQAPATAATDTPVFTAPPASAITIPSPAPTPEPMAQNDVAAANDATLARAVDQLTGEAPVEPLVEPATPTATNPLETPTAEPQIGAEAPTQPVEPTASTNPDNDHVDVVGKKVIQPLNDAAAAPNLEALLAKEEANEQGGAENAPRPIVVGGNTPATATNTEPQLDPNSIAL